MSKKTNNFLDTISIDKKNMLFLISIKCQKNLVPT